MSSTPIVSVVIPAYNYAHFLGATIDSVLAQSCGDFELLVIDDGSTDDTAAVVAAYSDPRIRYIHQTNAGLSAARNTGIREARTATVAFLDADDLWAPEKLARCMQTLAALDDTWGMVATHRERITPTGEPIFQAAYRFNREREITAPDLLMRTHFSPSTAMVRKACFAACGDFDTSLKSVEDRDMWLRIAARYRIMRLAEPLTLVRNHPTSMSKQADRMKAFGLRVLAKNRAAGLLPAWHPIWLRARSFLYFQSAWMYAESGMRRNAAWHVLLSILLWPIFANPGELGEPPLFRIRAGIRFLCRRQLR